MQKVFTDTLVRPEALVVAERPAKQDLWDSVLGSLDDPASEKFAGDRKRGEAALASETLSRYASLSGGIAFRVSDLEGLREAADHIAAELKHQYRLGWTPATGSTRFRRVAVQCPEQVEGVDRMDEGGASDDLFRLVGLQRPDEVPLDVGEECLLADEFLGPVLAEVRHPGRDRVE